MRAQAQPPPWFTADLHREIFWAEAVKSEHSIGCPEEARRVSVPMLEWLRSRDDLPQWQKDDSFIHYLANENEYMLHWLHEQPDCPQPHESAYQGAFGHLHPLWLGLSS
jgi:hypothetical protein